MREIVLMLLVLILNPMFALGQTPSGGRSAANVTKAPEVRVLFWDDFASDVGWKSQRTSLPRTEDAPSKWSSYVAATVEHEIAMGFGKNGRPGYRLKMDWPFNYAETGRLSCEFTESPTAHFRLLIKLSEGFQLFSPSTTNNFWKQWRLHQSPWTRGNSPPFGVNGESNSGFVVAGLLSNASLQHTVSWRSSDGKSSDGPLVVYKHANNKSVISKIPFGELQSDGSVTNTDWVQIDVCYSLGEPDKDNGFIRQWYNGVLQPSFDLVLPFYGAQRPITGDGLVTNPRSHYGNPPGYNSFTLFDNYNNLTAAWTKQHYVYVDSLVIYDGIPSDLPR